MATLQRRKSGYWELQYRENGRRRTITFSGDYSKRIADRFRGIVDVLIRIKKTRDPTLLEPDDKVWIESKMPEFGEKLSKVGLYAMPKRYTLGQLWDTFLEKFDKKETTEKTYHQVRGRFFAYFKEDELLTSLTKDRLVKWGQDLLVNGKTNGEGLGEVTVSLTMVKARAVMNWAIRQGWISESPFDGIRRGTDRNKANDRYIKPEEYRLMLEHCDNQVLRTILALARVAGMHPNEIVSLKWAHINWERGFFRVFNDKVQQHDEWYERSIPLFIDLIDELEPLWLQSENEEYVINRYVNRETGTLYPKFVPIAKKAGVGKIPRFFDNCRASVATEVFYIYGAENESRWLGHSQRIAKKHYIMRKGIDFDPTTGKMIVGKDAIRYLPEKREGETVSVLLNSLLQERKLTEQSGKNLETGCCNPL